MKNDSDSNYISTGKWMMLIFLPSIPLIGWILVLVLAFSGNNETRKNYFRALIAWVVLAIVCCLALGYFFTHSPTLMQHAKEWQAHQK